MNRAAFLLIAVGGLAACVEDKPASPSGVASGQCQITRIDDADTFDLSCGGEPAFTARLVGVDAPDINFAGCPAERAKGLQARAVLTGLLAEGPVTDVRRGSTLPDGRRLVSLKIAGQDLGQALRDAGLGVTFDNQTYPDWCAGA